MSRQPRPIPIRSALRFAGSDVAPAVSPVNLRAGERVVLSQYDDVTRDPKWTT